MVALFPILALISGSSNLGSALIDRLYPVLLLGSAEIDRLNCGAGRPIGDFFLVDILTEVWPPTGIVAWVVGLLRRVGEGDGRDLLEDGLEFDADLELGAVSLKSKIGLAF